MTNKNYKWAVVAMLWFVCFFNYADRQAIFSVFELLKSEMNLTDVQLGIVGAAFMWVYAGFGVIAGFIGDRVKRRLVILTAALGLFATVIAPLTRAASTGGQFLVQCGGPVRSASDDPIVGGASHSHEFYGNETISLGSTYTSLSAGTTACHDPHDKASYWHPTLYVRGTRVPLPKSTAYYTAHGKSRGSIAVRLFRARAMSKQPRRGWPGWRKMSRP